MPVFEIVVYGMLVPGSLAGLAALLSTMKQAANNSHIVLVSGLVVGLFSAYIGFFGSPSFRFADTEEIVLISALLVGLAFAVHSKLSLPEWVRFPLSLLLSVAIGWAIILPTNEAIWKEGNPWLWLFIMAHLLFLMWITHHRVFAALTRRTKSIYLTFTGVAVTLALANAGSLKLLEMSIALTSMAGAILLASIVQPKFELPLIVIPLFQAGWVSLLFAANRYAELPDASLLTILFVFFVPKLVMVHAKTVKDKQRLFAIFGLVLILALAAVAASFMIKENVSAEKEYTPLI